MRCKSTRLWRDFLNFPYFTGFSTPLDSEMICILRLYPNGIIIMDMNIVGGHMNIQNEKVNTKLLYSVGYVPEVDKYILSCVLHGLPGIIGTMKLLRKNMRHLAQNGSTS